MIKGYFKFGSPMIEITIEGIKIETLRDTGFNSYLMLPKKLIEQVGLEDIGSTDYTTASGEEKTSNVYKATINLYNKKIEVPILSTEGNFSLAGMELFHNYKIIIERHKNIVEIIETKN